MESAYNMHFYISGWLARWSYIINTSISSLYIHYISIIIVYQKYDVEFLPGYHTPLIIRRITINTIKYNKQEVANYIYSNDVNIINEYHAENAIILYKY